MIKTALLTTAFATLATAGLADTWTLNGDASHIAFGSVKNHYTGEIHTFSGLSGTVAEDGATAIEIALGTLETQVDIRNERMAEHVFNLMPTASISAQLDMDMVNTLDVGGSTVMEIDFDLGLLGQDVPLFGEVFVMRVGEDQVMVTTNTMVYVAADELGIDAGIDTLQEIAGLDDITRAVPVTMRFMFSRDASQGA